MKKTLWSVIILLMGILLFMGCSSQSTPPNLPIKEVTVFKSPNCGCCGIYSLYMQKEGFDVTVKEVTTMDQVKQDFKVPKNLESCHTTKIDNYFVEGHIPLEAIDKLLTEKPDIAGIALPGMPIGTPGMPGKKTEDWVIYAVNHDGTYGEFMTI